MKFGLVVVLALLTGSVAAHFLLADNGYVLFSFQGWLIEMSVPVLLLVLLLAYLAVRLLLGIWRAPRRLGEALADLRDRHAGRQATRGYIALAEGRLAKGEKLLTRGARRSNTPLLNYLAAARAAQMQGDRERRNTWLRLACEHEPAATDAVLLTQAELQIEDGEHDAALDSLNRVREQHPNHAQALKLLGELHFRREDWAALLPLLPLLRRRGNVAPAIIDEWTVRAYTARMDEAGLDRKALDQLWDELPRAQRRLPALVAARAAALIRLDASEIAETELRRALKEDWTPELVRLYGTLSMADPAAHLKRIEAWLAERREDPDLLLAAGRASIHHELWGKARAYLESSIVRRPTPEAYHELGQLMLRIGEEDEATSLFRNGLELSCAGPARLAAPSGDAG
ncbi:MAG: heme biosynthesis protein HemY [Chromatiales bacterium]|nr:heme biosynthesis protein HemY [Chromatiales bacterium]